MSLSRYWNLDFLALKKLTIANSSSSISILSQFLIWPNILLNVASGSGGLAMPLIPYFSHKIFFFFNFVLEVRARGTKGHLLFLICKNKVWIMLGSNGRNVCGTIPSFSTFYVFAIANSIHETNLCHNCPLRAAFRSEVQSDLGTNWVAILV